MYQGFRRDEASDSTPILADRPPAQGWGNSPNHGGTGQNVLFVGGNVGFFTTRTVGPENDEIGPLKLKIPPVFPGLQISRRCEAYRDCRVVGGR